MQTLPLEKYTRFASDDIDYVRQAMTAAYCEHGLHTPPAVRKLSARHHQVELGALSVNYLSYGAEVAVAASELDRFFLVDFPLSGSSRYRLGNQEFISAGLVGTVVSPCHRVQAQWSPDCQLITIKIDRCALENYLSSVLERKLPEPLTFEPRMDFSGGCPASFRALIDFLVHELDHTDSIRHLPAWLEQIERAVMSGLLAAQRSNYSMAMECTTPRLAPRYVHRAEAFMRQNLCNEIHVDDVVAAARVPARTLFAAYKRYLGIAPITHFRELRLRAAREELRNPKEQDTVAAIACRWGFSHFGHFSRDYFDRFGEKPSETLKRSR